MSPFLRNVPLRLALAASASMALAGTPWAQEAGFAVELTPPPVNGYETPPRVTVRQFGLAVEPATDYVRGCRGHVAGEGAAAVFELTGRFDSFAFTAHGEGLESLVVQTPDGLYRCAHAEDRDLASVAFSGAKPGRYRVWAGALEGAEIDVAIVAADRPVSMIELTGLDLAALGEPRAGRHDFAPGEENGRQQLVAGGRLFPEEPMRPLSEDWCAGYGRFDAADAVLVLEAGEPRLSIFAVSERDLTLAVVGPEGEVLCNDDSFGLNPSVTFDGAVEGAYHVFVGAFGQGPARESYDLYANRGAPQFGGIAMGAGGPPRMGFAEHDPRQAARGQHLATAPVVAGQQLAALVPGQFCSGYSGLDAPDVVLSVADPAEALSFYAVSPTDLVIAVRGPEGDWLCNDDTFGINPAVTFGDPAAGDYEIYVGAFAQGAEGIYALYAADGAPNWDAAAAPAPETLNVTADPAVARMPFGPTTRPDPRIIFDVPQTEFAVFDLGPDCAGFIDPTRPDFVIDVREGLPQLMIYMVAESDGTLAIVAPDGSVHCNDDFEGLHPGILFDTPEAGDYAVFAGTFDGSGGLATLGLTVASPVWTMDREG
jgi:hypothetical protein